jgi:hypothetical protein
MQIFVLALIAAALAENLAQKMACTALNAQELADVLGHAGCLRVTASGFRLGPLSVLAPAAAGCFATSLTLSGVLLETDGLASLLQRVRFCPLVTLTFWQNEWDATADLPVLLSVRGPDRAQNEIGRKEGVKL